MSGTGWLGATYEGDGVSRFRVWAPDRKAVEVAVEQNGQWSFTPLTSSAHGYFEGPARASPGTRYWYRLDGRDRHNDPCSRFQPDGPHGPSQVVDPRAFAWRDAGFPGAQLTGAVIYELHVGTFTPEGTYGGVREKLPYLRDLGATVLELLPLNTFPGRFNWGYDGTHLFAPCAVYGTPEELRALVDDAHRHGLSVILDVVYNHLGPDGNYLWQYAKAYFSTRHPGEWGEPLNFDGEHSAQVRRFIVENVRHWIAEYHLDGLRIDATQSLFDDSERHILSDLTDAARAAAPGKSLLIVAENEPQDKRTVTPNAQGGHGCDAMWIDDFHHSARVALTFRREAYLQDYRGTAQEWVTCARQNALYQGQWYAWQKQRRGTAVRGMDPKQFVFFLQDHDQIANFLRGDRLHVFGEPRMRAMTVMWLLLPQTPMLFMGQEFFASSPFLYFVDHPDELMHKVFDGRNAFVAQFQSAAHAFREEGYVEAIDQTAFDRSKLDWADVERQKGALLLHQELLRLRREDAVFRAQDAARLDASTLAEQALVLRWFGGEQEGDRLVVLNLGPDLDLDPCPEPLLAPPRGRKWVPMLSSKEIRFGGHGATFPDGLGTWTIQGQSGLVLQSAVNDERAPATKEGSSR